jgi:hypothetical protein
MSSSIRGVIRQQSRVRPPSAPAYSCQDLSHTSTGRDAKPAASVRSLTTQLGAG